MKYFILIISVCMIARSTIAQSSKPDTLVNERWFNGAWQKYSRTINNYDAGCRLQTGLIQNWDNTSAKWLDYSTSNYSYTSGNYISEILTRLWFNNAWNSDSRKTYTYDGSFKILSVVDQSWLLDHWSNYMAVSNKYDNNGHIDSVITQSSYNDEPFENTNLDTYLNDNEGKPQLATNQFWSKVSSTWVNYSKTSFVYNYDKTIHTAILALWNRNSAAWLDNTQTVYTYTGAGRLLNTVVQEWQPGQWVNQWLNTSYFDTNGFPSGVLTERWDGFDWEKYRQYSDKNNTDGTIYQHTTQYWGQGENAWVNEYRTTYSYSGSCLLPLNLLLFKAAKNANKVDLSWNDADELNVSHFTIQRSFNANDFADLGNIPSKNATGTNAYAHSDNIEKITAPTIYYRLKIVDKDGSYTYSKIVTVALPNDAITLRIYPVPAKDKLFIVLKMQNTNNAELRITDILGKVVYRNTVNNILHDGIAVVNISSLNKGIYFVLCASGSEIQRAQFIKP